MFSHIWESGIYICSFIACPLILYSLFGWWYVYFPFLRPEKMAKLPVILGNLDVTIDSVAPDLTSKPCEFNPRTRHES